jgi:CelD/BcsL family acetyltransferase involved in cellulose biosynthesis
MLAVANRTDRDVLTVERISDARGFAALKPEWDDLLKASASDCLFLTWEWLHTWWNHLAENRQLSILAIRNEGELIGIAPFARRPGSFSAGHPLPILEFLGTGQVGSDYLDVILRKGWEEQATSELAWHLTKERTMFRWTNLSGGACMAEDVASRLGRSGWSVTDTKINLCPYISLEGKTWESYLAELGSEHRYNFQRKWKRLNRDYNVSFDQVSTEAECRESIDLVIEQHNLRWRDRGGSDAFHTPGLVAFHREFALLAFKRGWLRLFVLRLDGQPVACLYGFVYGGTFYFYQSGFDPAFDKNSVGVITMGLAIKGAIEEGANKYDLLHGNEAYKSRWSCENRDLHRLELFPPGVMGRLSQTCLHLTRALRTAGRSVRGPSQ